jgi:hypothetical protein
MIFDSIAWPACWTGEVFFFCAHFFFFCAQTYRPGKWLAIRDHELPKVACARTIAKSSSADHEPLLIDGSRWLYQLKRKKKKKKKKKFQQTEQAFADDKRGKQGQKNDHTAHDTVCPNDQAHSVQWSTKTTRRAERRVCAPTCPRARSIGHVQHRHRPHCVHVMSRLHAVVVVAVAARLSLRQTQTLLNHTTTR